MGPGPGKGLGEEPRPGMNLWFGVGRAVNTPLYPQRKPHLPRDIDPSHLNLRGDIVTVESLGANTHALVHTPLPSHSHHRNRCLPEAAPLLILPLHGLRILFDVIGRKYVSRCSGVCRGVGGGGRFYVGRENVDQKSKHTG